MRRVNVERCSDVGALLLQVELPDPPALRLVRNGRMLGVEVSLLGVWFEVSVYRPPWGPVE